MPMRRHIICRFDDGDTFLSHFQGTVAPMGSPPHLQFQGDFGVPCGEVIRVSIIIADPGERHDLHLRVTQRTPKFSEGTADIRWRYRAVTTEADAPWLRMLLEKYATRRRMTPTAA